MKHRPVQWIMDVVRDPDTEPQAHFHQADSMPAVSYDERCGSTSAPDRR